VSAPSVAAWPSSWALSSRDWIEALLTLPRGQRRLDHSESFDLAAVTDTVLAVHRPEATLRGPPDPRDARARRDTRRPPLAKRLVANLVDNDKQPHGTTAGASRAVLSVANSGPLVPAEEFERLVLPFQRLGAERTHQSEGLGLGLSIVQAIATAYQATSSPKHNQPAGSRSRSASPPATGPPGLTVAGGDLKPATAAPEGGLA
jgi:signal transduction histidine kinase